MSHATNFEKVEEYLTGAYSREATSKVPKRTDLTFSNVIKKMTHVVVLYVDMRGSRNIIQNASSFWSIKVHRAFLQSIVYCVENRDGHFRSFNGDGALAFFVGENAASRAVRASLDIKAYVREINKVLDNNDIQNIDFGIGVAQGEVAVAKSGKKGDDFTKQDLVWVGLPVYVAVELSDYGGKPDNIWISPKVRSTIGKEDYLNVVTNSDGESMWTQITKDMKSVGEYKVRYTSYYSTIFE